MRSAAACRDGITAGVAASVVAVVVYATSGSSVAPDVLALSMLPCTVAVAAAGAVLLATSRTSLHVGSGAATWLGCGLLLMTGIGGLLGELWRATAAPAGGWLVAVPAAAVVVHIGLDRVEGVRAHQGIRLLLLAAAAVVLLSPTVPDLLGVPVWEVQVVVCAAALASIGWRCARRPVLPPAYRTAVVWGVAALALDSVLAVIGLTGPWSAVRAAVAVGGCAILLSVAWRWAGDAGRANVSRVDELVTDLAAREEETLRARTLLHDARATLAGIRAAREALEEGVVGTDERPQLERALEAEVHRLEHQLQGHLPTVVGCRVDEALAPLVVPWQRRGVDLAYDARPARVAADACTVAEIVGNLVDNARRHAPGSPIRITTDLVDGNVLLSVSDDGPGVPAALRESVLVAGTRGSSSEGEGLGLASAARLAHAVGGELTLIDADQGAWFLVRLPEAPEQG